jgi:hypothetical protein
MKPYCSQFTIKLKMGELINLQTSGQLFGIHKPVPKEAKTSLVAPDTLEPVKQFYVPQSKLMESAVPTSALLTRGDCVTANVIKDKVTSDTSITVLPDEHLDSIKDSSLPKNVMTVTVHRKEDADEAMFPLKESQSYVFYPNLEDPDEVQNYQLLVGIISDSKYTFCSVVNLQGHEGLWRLDVWRGRLTLVRQGFPDGLQEHEPPVEGEFGVVAVPESVIGKAVKGLSKFVEPIDPDTYRDRILAEKIELKGAVDSGEVQPVVEKETKATSLTDLEALFSSFEDS